ncbi:MAG: hypothetical protein RIQ33_1597 [Bacteroidota bacterium]|jgi:hypothetical protein
MKKIILLMLLLSLNKAYSQNLVLNPSFEVLRDTCWPWMDGISDSACLYWDCPIYQTPDYLNKCANSLLNGFMGVPFNWGNQGGGGGFQYAKDGDAYAGYWHLVGLFREYIQGRLSDSLQIGKKYKCYYYVVKQSSSYDSMNNFGMAFSTYHLHDSTTLVADLNYMTPKINDTTVINDTLNWVKIEGTFIADSNYKYFTIGNFFSAEQTIGISSYFYVDDVHVELVENDGVEEVGVRKLEVYPNPCGEKLLVTGYQLLGNTIEVTDVLGRILQRDEASNQQINNSSTQQIQLDVSSLPNGIYFIKATDMNGNLMNGKFVKE